jgi:hypothetical protein
MHTHSPRKPKYFKQILPARKLMAALFWGREGVLMVKCMQGITIISEVYCETLKELRRTDHSEK